MTERRKQWLNNNGWGAIITSLLSIIGLLLIFIGNHIINKIDDHENRLDQMESLTFNIGKTTINMSDWIKQHEAEDRKFHEETSNNFKEIWQHFPNIRGGNIQYSTRIDSLFIQPIDIQ